MTSGCGVALKVSSMSAMLFALRCGCEAGVFWSMGLIGRKVAPLRKLLTSLRLKPIELPTEFKGDLNYASLLCSLLQALYPPTTGCILIKGTRVGGRRLNIPTSRFLISLSLSLRRSRSTEGCLMEEQLHRRATLPTSLLYAIYKYIMFGRWLRRANRWFCSAGSNHPKTQQISSPYTLEIVGEKAFVEMNEIFLKIGQAEKAHIAWRQLPLVRRKAQVKRFVQSILAERMQQYQAITSSVGKSIKDIDLEYAKVARLYEPLINSADEIMRDVVIEDSPKRLIKYSVEPIGLVLMFPYYADPIMDSIVKLIPSLVAGNAVLIKSPPNAPFIGEYLSRKMQETCAIPELISDLYISAHQTPEVVKFRQIRQITFTGSHSSGKHIFELVAKERFIDCNLFFGSNDAGYIDQTANVDQAVEEIVNSAFSNNGQSIGAMQRLYIHASKHDEVVAKLVDRIASMKIGDPMDSSVDLGPLCLQQNVLTATQLIEQAVVEGAVCHTGGTITTDGKTKGKFLEPTILTSCQANMAIVQNQMHCPVLCCSEVSSVDEFIQQVQANAYGLAVRIFTSQPQRYKQHVARLQVGMVAFNCADYLTHNLPIQGWKRSGKGKYLSALSYEQFVKYKSYYVEKQ